MYNPKKTIHHLPVKGKAGKVEDKRMRNGSVADTLTRAFIQEIVKNGGQVIEISERFQTIF